MTTTDLLADVCELAEPAASDSVDGIAPRVVARPASTQETSALLRACHEQDLAVVVRGHGSKLAWGRPPERLDVLLDTTRMDELVEHSRGDLVATAGAGMPLARLQERLGQGRHQLVVDDLVGGTLGGSTLGGAVATNLAGPRRMWVGSTSDVVIGVRFVRADGTVAKAGGKVVKNVAGYDLSKLLTGSFGTLAVLTEVTVRLHPVPQASLWVGLTTPADHLADVVAGLVSSQLVPHAVEVHVVPDQDPVVVALVTGTPDGAAARAEALAAGLGEQAWVADEAPSWWGRLPTTGEAEEPRPLLLRATARLSGIPQLVGELSRHGASLTGSAGAGVLHASLPGTTAPEAAAAAVEAVRRTSTALGGSTVVLDAAPGTKRTLDSWGPVPALDLMRRVKAEFDPGRILAPGRFVGGL
ncbi:FAD-binding oxidoreductase [Ornithinimicrobium sp. LYQ121]|uniref:FAD-binding oxidoreductase n=1 Tax=Ornithinimicrobium sp. LYQ121 TaxID=3378801 RepID=UPI0038525AAE